MTNLFKATYTGLSHFRELLAADFKKFGVEAERHLFKRGEALVVTEDVAKMIAGNLPDEFSLEAHAVEEVAKVAEEIPAVAPVATAVADVANVFEPKAPVAPAETTQRPTLDQPVEPA